MLGAVHNAGMSYLFPPEAPVGVPLVGRDERFPVRRVYCVGRNYAAHAREMGFDPDREPPFFFCKPANAVVVCPPGQETAVPYPSQTDNLHHEIELVVAIGGHGRDVPEDQALSLVAGYAVGLDMTRRDLQLYAREKGRPWDLGKDFEESAVCSEIVPMPGVVLEHAAIAMEVNERVTDATDVREEAEVVAAIRKAMPVTMEGVEATRVADV